MRGMLMHHENISYIIAVEYLLQESGMFDNGGLTDWEGTFVPDQGISASNSLFVLELEDGRRGRIQVTVRIQAPNSPEAPIMYRFRGTAGL